MSYPDLSGKIKLNSEPLLEEKKEEKVFTEEINIKKDTERLSECVAVLISKAEKKKLEEIAIKNERSVSYIARKAIKEFYKIK